MNNLPEILLFTIAASFLASLILCTQEAWRRPVRAVSRPSTPATVSEPVIENPRGWRLWLVVLLGMPLMIVLSPVLLGAILALLLVAFAISLGRFRRLVARHLRQRHTPCAVPLSFVLAPILLIRRWPVLRTRKRQRSY